MALSLDSSSRRKAIYRSKYLWLTIAVPMFLLGWGVYAGLNQSDYVKFTPYSISVNPDSSLPAEVRALEQDSVGYLIDRDTYTDFAAFGKSEIVIELGSIKSVDTVKFYAASPYIASIDARSGSSWDSIKDLQRLQLKNLGETWNAFVINDAISTDALKITLDPVKSGSNPNATPTTSSSLHEIEIWGRGDRLAGKDSATLRDAALSDAPPQHAAIYTAPQDEQIISADGTVFSVNIPANARDIKHAWLSYDAYGISHWISAVRDINGNPAQGGNAMFTNDATVALMEPINPDWLLWGENRFTFAVPPQVTGNYSVSNVRVLIELEDGSNFISSLRSNHNDGVAANLGDGDNNTGWTPYASSFSGEKPELEIYFDKTTQAETLLVHLTNYLNGLIGFSVLFDGEWVDTQIAPINARQFSAGWNEVDLRGLPASNGLKLTFERGSNSAGQINELTLLGSGVGRTRGTHIAISYPDAGQFYGRNAYIHGYLELLDNGSGTASLFIAGLEVPHVDGAFGVVINKDEAGFAGQSNRESWQVEVAAVYPDGERVSTQVQLGEHLDAGLIEGVLPFAAASVNAQSDEELNHEGATLDVDPDALDEEVTLKITPLGQPDIPALNPGMTNVTRGPHSGYRFTPHGTKFKKNVKVSLPFDEKKLPPGHSVEDIKTYYFDEESGRWMALERVSIDQVKDRLTSNTDHFTDMINATITVPESPQAASFNPTSIKDIKAADPGAGINLIEPPQANNQGTANLSYPIEIPPGRNGMQPQIAVQYNSGGGNGWMGVGWDIPMQSISIDTRWGVPRYDTDKESETYSLNGEMLTPVAHRTAWEDLPTRNTSGSKEFHTRIEGQFRRIIRHGNSPKDYWWEVTDKNGAKYFYGGGPDINGGQGGTSVNSILTDKVTNNDGNIFTWTLREMRDSNGNTVKYSCERIQNTGVDGGTVKGHNLYLSKIEYTGHVTENGNYPYSIDFIRDSDRVDVSIDARGGFKKVTADLLREIRVNYEGEVDPVRSYQFNYEPGAFEKTRLKEVVQRGPGGESDVFNRHTFSYYDEIPEATSGSTVGYAGFDEKVDWLTGSDDVNLNLLGIDFDASLVSGSTGKSTGRHGYNGIFIGTWTDKTNSFGKASSSSSSTTQGVLSLIDIDGDGLPDKVYKNGGALSYRRNTWIPGSALDTEIEFGGSRSLSTLPQISSSTSISSSSGIEGYYGGGSATRHNGDTVTTEQSFFTDVNGDGLIDEVSNGVVYFGYFDSANPDLENEQPQFDPDSANSLVTVGTNIVDTENLLPDLSELKEKILADNPLSDAVRRWKAPYSGMVRIEGLIQLKDFTDVEALTTELTPELTALGLTPEQIDEHIAELVLEREKYLTADGVRLAIQKNDTEKWVAEIGPDDYEAYQPNELINVINPEQGLPPLEVNKGDRLYFRSQSVFDGAYDDLTWQPSITYIGKSPSFDANNLNVYQYDAGDDYVLAGRDVEISAPFDGVLKLSGNIIKSAVTTDDITLKVIRTTREYNSQGEITSSVSTTVYQSETLAHDQTYNFPLYDVEFEVSQRDALQIKFDINSQIDLTTIEWQNPQLYYISGNTGEQITTNPNVGDPGEDDPADSGEDIRIPVPDDPETIPGEPLSDFIDENGNPKYALPIVYDANNYPENKLTINSPQGTWSVPNDKAGYWYFTPWVTIKPSNCIPPTPTNDNGNIPPWQQEEYEECVAEYQAAVKVDDVVTFTIKRRGELVNKWSIPINNGVVDQSKNGFNGFIGVDLETTDELFLDFSSRDPELASYLDTTMRRHYASQTAWTAPLTDTLKLRAKIEAAYEGRTSKEAGDGEQEIDLPFLSREVMLVMRKNDAIVVKQKVSIESLYAGNSVIAQDYFINFDDQASAGDKYYFDIFDVDERLRIDHSSVTGSYYEANTWIADIDGGVRLAPKLTFKQGFSSSGEFELKVYDKNRDKIATLDYQVTNGVVSRKLWPNPDYPGYDFIADQGEIYSFDFNFLDYWISSALLDRGLIKISSLDEEPETREVASYGLHTKMPRQELRQPDGDSVLHHGVTARAFSSPYRGWAVIGYNGNNYRNKAMVESRMVLSTRKEDYNLDSVEKVFIALPEAEPGAWLTSDDDWLINGIKMTPSRNGLNYIRFPQASDFADPETGYAVRTPKMSHAETRSWSAGYGISYNESKTDPTISLTDHIDLNGDRYPDILHDEYVQFTRMDGGLENQAKNVIPDETRSSWADSKSISIGPAPINADNDAQRSAPDFLLPVVTALRKIPKYIPSPTETDNGDRSNLLDVNGDGLPDKVRQADSKIEVAINLGYSFADYENWGTAKLNDGSSLSITESASLPSTSVGEIPSTDDIPQGWGTASASFSGGASISAGINDTKAALHDLNGDGLLDRVYKGSGGYWVGLNVGGQFLSPVPWTGGVDRKLGEGINISASANVSATLTINLAIPGLPPIPFSLHFTRGKTWGESISRQEIMLRDINGDGYADSVFSDSENKMKVALNRTGRSNLLKSINRPLGAVINLEYERTGNTFNLPQSRWVMSQVSVFDGVGSDTPSPDLATGSDYMAYSYDYLDGQYDRFEREFFGFEQVITEELNTLGRHVAENADDDEIFNDAVITDLAGAEVYRRVTQSFRTDSFYTKGLLSASETVGRRNPDGSGDLVPYRKSTNEYHLKHLISGTVLTELVGNEADEDQIALLKIYRDNGDSIFPQLHRTEQFYFEGGSTSKSMAMEHEYDDIGNVIVYRDLAEPGITEDNVVAEIKYSQCQESYIVGKPTQIIVKNQLDDGEWLRKREADYDCDSGNLKEVRQFIDDDRKAITLLDQYDDFGNLKHLVGPVNDAGESIEMRFDYDTVTHTYPVSVTNVSYGLTSGASYNYKFGKPQCTVDTNANPMRYDYDSVGRSIRIVGPYELDEAFSCDDSIVNNETNSDGSPFTIKFTYDPNRNLDSELERKISVAKTEHYNRDANNVVHPDYPSIDTWLFTDGIKRVLQTKKTASIDDTGSVRPGRIVSGRVSFDALGRSIRQYYPIAEFGGGEWAFDRNHNTSVDPTKMQYDALDRNVSTTLPDETETTIDYGFGQFDGALLSNYFVTTVTDANLNQKSTYRDVRELINAVTEEGGLLTQYEYDPLKQITLVTDDVGNETDVDYDNLGRRISIDNPDTGFTEYKYDLASNLIEKITANQAGKTGIVYRYDHTRLKNIVYPTAAYEGNNVEYVYGDELPDNERGVNQLGRIARVTHQGGTDTREYGKLGEVTYEKRQMDVIARGQGETTVPTYETRYDFDTFGRLMTLILPDGEVITHGYDAGGSLNQITGDSAGKTYPYLTSLTYDVFEQRRRMELGNGINTRYHYDPEHRRLCRLESGLTLDESDLTACDNAVSELREASSLTVIESTFRDEVRATQPGQFQNLHYAYDRVGNILGMGNAVQTSRRSELGGPATQAFEYDNLYRLDMAQGQFITAQNLTHEYSLDMAYDSIHNITRKDQKHELVRGDKRRTERATTYEWGYAYTGQQPHAPSQIGNRTFSYDANGNQLGWESTVNGTRRNITWDDENRIQKIGDPQNTLTFAYDDSGTRVLKRDQLGQTEYVNQFFTVRNEALASKHIFAGTSRIATKVEPGQPVGTDPSAGSSTTTTTTATEQPVQSKKPVDKGKQNKPEPQEKGFFDKLADFVNPGQGRDKRSETANEHAQDIYQNPTLTGEFPGQGKGNNGKTPPGQGGDNPGQGQGQGQGPADPGNGNGGNNGNGNGNSGQTAEGGVFLYYYHPDHLGSTGYVTDENAELYEHIQYFPFGETWVQQAANSDMRIPYRYTSKELDEETGLYYYGARYYDPRTSVWQSVDPILGSYLGGEPNGGVYRSTNLSSYVYTFHNPVNFIDPDGKAAIVVVYTDYKISVGGERVPFLGHAGVVIVDDNTGGTRYYEYGRYDAANLGEVRRRSIPDLIMEDGKPTYESMKNLMSDLSGRMGQGGDISAQYDENSTNYLGMVNYAEARMAQNNNPDREEYGICYNNCFSFAEETAQAGYEGFDKFLNSLSVDPTPDWPNAKADIDIRYDSESRELGGTMYLFDNLGKWWNEE